MLALAGKLRERNHNIIFGAGDDLLKFLQKEMPGLTYIGFPGFRPSYSSFLPQYIVLIFLIPSLIYHTIKEHIRLKKIIARYHIDIVISDNRFGLWNKNIRTVYITHQPLIPFPGLFSFMEFTGVYLHRLIIRKYSLCLIPDLPGELNLTGRLSHGVKLPVNTIFTGILSRFQGYERPPDTHTGEQKGITVILSGPEPQRGILEKKLTDLILMSGRQAVIIGGKPHETQRTQTTRNITRHNHLNRQAMQDVLTGSETIITRPGYTTIMELVTLRCSALLVPTPGQTEQEYLAEYLTGRRWFSSISQGRLNVNSLNTVTKAEWNDEIITRSNNLLEKAVKEILQESQTEA